MKRIPKQWQKHARDITRMLHLLHQTSATVSHDADHDLLMVKWADESAEFMIGRNRKYYKQIDEDLDGSTTTLMIAYNLWESSRLRGHEVCITEHAPWSAIVSKLGRRILEIDHADAMDAINPTSEVVRP